jgi:hypothetical protein
MTLVESAMLRLRSLGECCRFVTEELIPPMPMLIQADASPPTRPLPSTAFLTMRGRPSTQTGSRLAILATPQSLRYEVMGEPTDWAGAA